jgi:hypothetical protein
MRILFLDFDGVLHPLGLKARTDRMVKGKPVATVIPVDFFCWVPLLEELLAPHPDVRLVVHSSWRDNHAEAALGAYLGPLKDRYLGATCPEVPKLESIHAWLQVNPHVRSYRILDDAVAEFVTPAADECETLPVPELIATEWDTGIQLPAVQAQLNAWLEATA